MLLDFVLLFLYTQVYFWNKDTGVVTWIRPEELDYATGSSPVRAGPSTSAPSTPIQSVERPTSATPAGPPGKPGTE